MKTAMFIFCLVTAVCSLLFVHFMLTEVSSAWRWIFIIPGIISAFFYGCWSWRFRPWHKTYAC
ncbi:MAG: hypothetical protein V8R23_03860 [Alphaproteobacteria bacterium]|jgi:ascorbate-specific PTS system EIIC-type component UlaA|uniref:hypothetical protein n=1 Tax=Candidatus Scatocola faecipullorum TaxID=2840917 RepID=UPI00304D7530